MLAGWVNTQRGISGPVDKSLLENIRRANLWEGEQVPRLGIDKGTTAGIRAAAKELRDGNATLRTGARTVAAKLRATSSADQEACQTETEAVSAP